MVVAVLEAWNGVRAGSGAVEWAMPAVVACTVLLRTHVELCRVIPAAATRRPVLKMCVG